MYAHLPSYFLIDCLHYDELFCIFAQSEWVQLIVLAGHVGGFSLYLLFSDQLLEGGSAADG